MKKILLLIAGIILFIPISVKAADSPYWDCPGGTGGAPGSQVTCNFYHYSESPINEFSATLGTKGNTTIVSINEYPGQGWIVVSKTGDSIALSNPNPKQFSFPVLTVVYRISPQWQDGDDCGITITPLGGYTVPTPDPGTPTTPQNPETGAFMPYILVGTGAIIAIAVYLQASKREKFYKI